jgi:glycosyltransferase involved in cell wall biosynthesis
MNILMINPSLQKVCGRTKMSLLLAEALHQREYDISFLTSEDSDRSITDALPYRVLYGPVSPEQKGFFAALHLRKAIKKYSQKFKTDIVHTHHRYAAFISGAALHRSVAHLTSVHSFVEGKTRYPITADAWVAVSNAVKLWLMDAYEMEDASIEIIRNGVDNPSTDEQIDRGSRSPFTVLAAGRFSPEKGFDILLNAWELLIGNSEQELKLIIAGAGPEEESLKAMASKLGASVEICNGADRMDELYKACDLVVIPSRSEPLSYILLEAAMRRIPLLCSNTGGPAELISDGETGLLVEPEDAEALTMGLRVAIRQYNIVSEYASALFEQLRLKHTVDTMTDAYIQVYNRILESRRLNNQ